MTKQGTILEYKNMVDKDFMAQIWEELLVAITMIGQRLNGKTKHGLLVNQPLVGLPQDLPEYSFEEALEVKLEYEEYLEENSCGKDEKFILQVKPQVARQ